MSDKIQDTKSEASVPEEKQTGAEAALITIEGPGPLAPLPCPIDWTRPVRVKGSYGITHPVRIIAIDHSLTRSVIGVVGDDKKISEWHYTGEYDARTPGTCLDLENIPEVQP